MQSRLTGVAVLFLLIMPFVVVTQTAQATRSSTAAEQPVLTLLAFVETSKPDWVVTLLFAVQPAIPLKPLDVLKGDAEGMNLIAQRLSANLISISQAYRADPIAQDEAKYLIQERYQLVMKHQLLGARRLQHAIKSNARRWSACWLAHERL